MRFNKSALALFLTCVVVVYLLYKRNNSKLINLKLVLKCALHASELGGKAVVESKNDLIIKQKGLTKEGLEDRVTSADYISHCLMVKKLNSEFPSLNVLSEESDTSCKNTDEVPITKYQESVDLLQDEWVNVEDLTVWVDPLDATHEYTEKLYKYVTTMVCVAFNGKPIIGVIHKPFQNVTSWAWVGKAESPDLKKSEKVDNEKLRISISRSHSGKIRDVLDEKLGNYELIVAAGAGYKSLLVAHQEVDAYLHITAIKKWDICAGNAILDAVGGQMTDKQNEKIDYSREANVVNENGLIAALQDHSTFLNLLQ